MLTDRVDIVLSLSSLRRNVIADGLNVAAGDEGVFRAPTAFSPDGNCSLMLKKKFELFP